MRLSGEDWEVGSWQLGITLPAWADGVFNVPHGGLTEAGLRLLGEISPEGAEYWPGGGLMGPRPVLAVRSVPGGPSMERVLERLEALLDEYGPGR